MKINRINNTKNQKALAKAFEPYLGRVIAPILGKLGIFPQQEGRKYIMNVNLAFEFTVPPRKQQFTEEEILDAARSGEYPPGMTAQDLVRVSNDSSMYKHETCLHLAARNGKMPKGTCLNDLLDTRGGAYRRPLFALFQYRKPHYTPDITAQDLAKIKQSRWGTFLHEAAKYGIYPKGTTISDLMSVRNKMGETPLHIAARFGGLMPCSKVDLVKVKDLNGRTPWDRAVETLVAPEYGKKYWEGDREKAVRNIIAVPVLASKLRPVRNEFHHEVLAELLASRKLTPEIRDEIAKYPQVCAAML